jgi:hypothetical protein
MALDYEFTPIDVRILAHPKAFKAGIEAMGLWLYGQAYARTHNTGGIVDRDAVDIAWGGKRNTDLARKLVAAGLWSENEDGDYEIHNYEAKTGHRKGTSAERMARFREKKRASSIGSVTCDVTPVTSDVTPVTSDVTPVTSDVTSDAHASHPSVSISVSSSVSDSTSESSEGVQGETQTDNPPDRVVVVDTGTRRSPEVDDLWTHYVATRLRYGRKTRKREPNREDRKAIVSALKSYDLETLKLAVEGLFLSEFHVGQDFTGVEYALRDSNVEKFAGAAERDRVARAPRPIAPVPEGGYVDPAEIDRALAMALAKVAS